MIRPKIKELFELLLVAIVVMVMGLGLGVGLAPDVSAELSKSKSTSLSGYNNTGILGNTASAQTGVRVGKPAEVPDKINCIMFVTNTSGTIDGTTATGNLETSYDNTNWSIFQTVAVGASEIIGVYNTPKATTPMGSYWRVNITAISNANDSNLNTQCNFE